MPVHNASGFLDASIGSLLRQSHTAWELICVDDGSTDDSLAKLRDYATSDQRIRVYSQANAGPAQARKLGISHASGDYIAYLDADDTWSDDYLSETLAAAAAHDADVVIPTLKYFSFMAAGEPLDFNARHGLKAGQELRPRDAFMRTFPWSVHGFCLYRAEHMKRFALTEISDVNNFNADEFLTRHLLLYASRIVVSNGTYFYGVNDASITRKFSTRKLGALAVNDRLYRLAVKEGLDDADLQQIANYSFKIWLSLKLEVAEHRRQLTEDEARDAREKLERRYSWQQSVNFRAPGMLRARVVSHLPDFFLRPLSIARNRLRSGRVA
jgi:glycosyltransferase involved in cell wall biosynthesis